MEQATLLFYFQEKVLAAKLYRYKIYLQPTEKTFLS